jgi:multidrug efflux pump subunit AcrA (membrane-fusion protein)
MRKAILLMMAAVALLPACKDGKKASELTDDSKLQYTPEVNEVEVVPLKRETFQMQLLANGKLSAAQKSALYFAESGQIVAINVQNGGSVGQGAVIARLDSREQESRRPASRWSARVSST